MPVVWLSGWSLPDGDIPAAASPADAVELVFAALDPADGSP
jgi:hypothetical protein